MLNADAIDGKTVVRRPTNVTLPESLLRTARALNINVSQACEQGLAAEVAKIKAQLWLEENSSAIDAWNSHFEEHGLPLAQYRQYGWRVWMSTKCQTAFACLMFRPHCSNGF